MISMIVPPAMTPGLNQNLELARLREQETADKLVRDFSEESLNNLLGIVEAVTPKNGWASFWDWAAGDNFISVQGWFGALGIDAKVKDIDRYHRLILDKKDTTWSEINSIFERVYEIDHFYAGCLSPVLESADEVLQFVKQLRDAISTDLPTMRKGLSEMRHAEALLQDTISRIETTAELVQTAGFKPLTDEELLHFCQEEYNYRTFYDFNYYNETLGEIGFGTALLISMFGREKILFKNLLNGYSIQSYKHFKNFVLEDKLGRDVISEVMQQTGMEREKILLYMQNGPRVSTAFQNKGSYSGSFITAAGDLPYSEDIKIEAALKRIYNEMLDNGTLVPILAAELGIQEKLIAASMNGEIDGYSVQLYEAQLSSVLDDISSREDFKLYNSQVKTVVKFITTYGAEANYVLLDDKRISKETFENVKGILKGVGKASEYTGYADDVIDYVEYLATDYTMSIKTLESLAAHCNGDINYMAAIQNLKDQYTEKVPGLMEKLINDGVKEVLGEGFSYLTKEGVAAAAGVPVEGPSLYSLVTAGLDLGGVVTGAKSYANSAEEFAGLVTVNCNNISAYSQAVELVRGGDTSEAALTNVRMTFEVSKYSTIALYESMLNMEKSHFLGIDEDGNIKAYLKNEIAKLKSLQLGETEAIAQSYEDFLEQYGH